MIFLGLLIIIIPICAGFIYGLRYFEKLEKETEKYLQREKPLVSLDGEWLA